MSTIINPIASLRLLVEEELAILPLTQFPLLNRVNKKTIGQQYIKWNANTGGASVTGELTSTAITTASNDVVIPAQLPIGGSRLRNSFTELKTDIAQAKTAGVGQLRDLFGSDIQFGMRALMEALNGKLYTGAGVAADGGVFGLENIIDPTQNYANINVSTYPNWISYVNGNSGVGRALTQDLLLQMEVSILRNGGTFTAIYTTPELVAKYKKLFTTTVYQVSQLGKTPDLGYTGVEYAGWPNYC